MAKAKRIFALVKRLSGPNKGKTYKRFFKSEAHKAKVMPRYSGKVTTKAIPKKGMSDWAKRRMTGLKKSGAKVPDTKLSNFKYDEANYRAVADFKHKSGVKGWLKSGGPGSFEARAYGADGKLAYVGGKTAKAAMSSLLKQLKFTKIRHLKK